MKSPFPGMDPYLEGDLWPEVHTEMASKIKKMLIPLVGEKYVVRIEKYLVTDTEPYEDMGIIYPIYPDVEVFENKVSEPAVAYGNKKTPTPPSLTVHYYNPVEVRIAVVEIRDIKNNKVVTVIEILSPVNKRSPGLKPYLEKKQRLIQNGVHFIEIDLIRRGKRTVKHEKLDQVFYLIALTRAKSFQTEVWTMDLDTSLPIIPIPLIPPDEDVFLDLQQALEEVYIESVFYRSIDYTDKPPPPVMPEEIYEKYTDKVVRTKKP